MQNFLTAQGSITKWTLMSASALSRQPHCGKTTIRKRGGVLRACLNLQDIITCTSVFMNKVRTRWHPVRTLCWPHGEIIRRVYAVRPPHSTQCTGKQNACDHEMIASYINYLQGATFQMSCYRYNIYIDREISIWLITPFSSSKTQTTQLKERDRQTDRQRQSVRLRETDRDRQRVRPRHTMPVNYLQETDRQTERERDRQTDRVWDWERQTESQTQTHYACLSLPEVTCAWQDVKFQLLTNFTICLFVCWVLTAKHFWESIALWLQE